jgi:coenzyme F420-0:L-glutamate ligase / coenzyme F420-1:gamma-L-glutamate ligase
VSLTIHAVDGIGEVTTGTSLVGLLAGADLRDGDVVVLTSKVVSKAEGLVVRRDRADAIADETVRVVARRGPTSIVENHLGMVMAAAGVDSSHVETGHVVLLPRDPDATARTIREGVLHEQGVNVAVLVSDTVGRAWRNGQTDVAIGAAGIEPLEHFRGQRDAYGNELAVTAPAVADELAGIAEVASGKLGGRPVVVVTGLADRVLPAGEHGPGARVLVRERGQDMFGLGSREAVVAALRGEQADVFGAPASAEELVEALAACGIAAFVAGDGVAADVPARDVALRALATAFGWRVDDAAAGPQPLLRPHP